MGIYHDNLSAIVIGDNFLPTIVIAQNSFNLSITDIAYVTCKKTSSNALKAYRNIYRKNLSAIIYRLPISLKKIEIYRLSVSPKAFLKLSIFVIASIQKGLSCPSLTITIAYGLLKNMQFEDDSCAIKDINKRLSNSDLESIINCTNLTIDPTNYALLQKAQSTSAAVERSFSMLNKLLRKDRNFDVKNVKKYVMLYYNKTSL